MKKINNKKTRSSIIKIPELLAPAGSYFMAVEAFKNGADAVYLGLKSHNARVGCDNFSRPEYASIIEFAKKSGKKVYLTLNTIIKENEIYEIYETLQFIDRVRPDALIVQDPGIIRIVKQNFPSIQLHSSTQMGAHNSFSIKTFERMGISRIILERQLTIEEIRSILENTKTEIEVFIHGALCCSLSGKCLFSSWLGGYSGNRGRCKQPCRRRFHGTSGNGFFFSTRDLCGLENLLDLAACKVSSFKIEGRLRGIDYVSKTVKAYRMLLDSVPFKSILAKTIEGIQPEPEEVKQYKLCLKASGALLGSLPSRTWSGLFKSSNDFKDMVKHEIMGVQGRYIGKVDKIDHKSMHILLSHPLSLEDRLRIQSSNGNDGPAVTIRSLKNKFGKTVSKIKRGDTACIEPLPGIQRGDMVFLTGRNSFDKTGNRFQQQVLKPAHINPASFGAGFDVQKITQTIDLDVVISTDFISIKPHKAENGFSWKKRIDFPSALEAGNFEEVVLKELGKISYPGFTIGKVNINYKEIPFINQRDLKSIRRDYQEWLSLPENMLLPHLKEYARGINSFFENQDKNTPDYKGKFKNEILKNQLLQFNNYCKQGPFSILKNDPSCFTNALFHEKQNFNTLVFDPRQRVGKGSSKRGHSRSDSIETTRLVKSTEIEAFENWAFGSKSSMPAQEAVLPSFCPEKGLNSLLKLIRAAIKKGLRRFQAAEWFNFSLLMQACEGLDEAVYQDLIISTSYPLCASNSHALDQILCLGASNVTLWPELEKTALMDVVSKRPDFSRICVKSRLPLMTTRADIKSSGKVTDSRGDKFLLRKNRGITTVYPGKILSIPSLDKAAVLVDYRNLSEKNECDTFNFDKELI